MISIQTTPISPERLKWTGAAILSLLFLGSIGLVFLIGSRPPLFVAGSLSAPAAIPKERIPLLINLQQNAKFFFQPSFDLQKEWVIAIIPPRPGGSDGSSLYIRLNKSGQLKKLQIPSRLYLQYLENGELSFADMATSFWAEFQERGNQIDVKVAIEGIGEKNWLVIPQEMQPQEVHTLPGNCSFRLFTEAKWWGPDLFRKMYQQGAAIHRLELGALPNIELVEWREGDLLVFENGQWELELVDAQKGSKLPMARIKSFSAKELLIEGWDGCPNSFSSCSGTDGAYYCFSLPLTQSNPLKVRGEELFTALRARSEKQVSCSPEKQWLVLRSGDWVLKTNNHWKILRKQSERKAFIEGKLSGELFVFDRIESRGMQKIFSGHLFNVARSQMVKVEIPVQQDRKPRELQGKGR